MTKAADLAHQLTQARNELNNLRKKLRGLQAEHRRDVSQLKEVIARGHTKPVPQPADTYQQPARPTNSLDTDLLCDWKPIGHVESWFRTKNGTPRQGSVSSLTRGVLRLAQHTFNNPHHALQGLEDFSYVWILFVFDKNEEKGRSHVRPKVAPPRLDGERVGVFGTRSPHRPNPLGLTLARLDKVEGGCLHLSGLDILDGTPVLDIKPYILHYDAPPAVTSHFLYPTKTPSSAKTEEEDEDSLFHDMLLGGKYSYECNQEENRPSGSTLKAQIQTEKQCSGDSLSNQVLEKLKLRQGKCQSPDVDRGEKDLDGEQREMEHDYVRCAISSFELNEDKMKEYEMGVSGDTQGSVRSKGEEVGGKRSAVLMAQWVAASSTALLQVLFNPIAEKQVQAFSCQAKDKKYRLEYLTTGKELKEAITSVLREDPRSVYRRRKCPALLYYLSVDTAHITAWFEGSCAEVLRVQPLSTQSHVPL